MKNLKCAHGMMITYTSSIGSSPEQDISNDRCMIVVDSTATAERVVERGVQGL